MDRTKPPNQRKSVDLAAIIFHFSFFSIHLATDEFLFDRPLSFV